MDFYDRNGAATVYFDGNRVRLWNGEIVAIVQNNAVYTNQGKHIGFFKDGWIRDRVGNAVAFSADARGGPMKPMRQMPPMKAMKSMAPMAPMLPMAPMMPMASATWSNHGFTDLLTS